MYPPDDTSRIPTPTPFAAPNLQPPPDAEPEPAQVADELGGLPPFPGEPIPAEPVDPLEGMEQRERIAYSEACAELEQGGREIDAIWQGIEQEIRAELDPAGALLSTVTDELFGAADLQLQEAYVTLQKWTNRLASDTHKPLSQSNGELMSAGFLIPWSVAEMKAASEGDWLQLVAAAAPTLAPFIGVTPPAPQIAAEPPTEYVSGSIADPGTDLVAPTLPVPLALPTNLVTGGPVPGVSLSATAPGTADAGCCPAPVNVVVNVPPIALPPITVAPSGAAPAPPPPAGPRPYPGTPPSIMIALGQVTYNTTNNTWYYTQAAPPADDREQPDQFLTVNVPPTSSPPVPPSSPPTSPPSATSSLLFPALSAGIAGTTATSVSWNSMDACSAVTKVIEATKPGGIGGKATQTGNAVQSYLETTFGGGAYSKIIEATGGNSGQTAKFFDQLSQDAGNSVAVGMRLVDALGTQWMLGGLAPQQVPNLNAAGAYGLKIAAAQQAEQRTGYPMMYLAQGDSYIFQYANPQFLPNQIRIDQALLAHTIDEATWECWTRANGNLPEPARRILVADQVKPNLREIIDLYRRGNISKEDFPKRAREVGVLNSAYLQEWLDVTRMLPTQSDLIRFMVRDASDDTVAKLYGYDSGFEQKFTPQMEAWAKMLGLDPTYFKYQWRAHWDIPSYTQLTEMLARLRPDRLEVKEWAKAVAAWEAGGKQGAAPQKPLVVTEEDVLRALQINDMAPGWVRELVAVSYTPINRTDAIRAYMTGAFDDEQLYDAFRNARYSERDARIMLAYYSKDKARRMRNVAGTWSPRKIIRFFKLHLLTSAEAEELLRPIMPNAAMVREVIEGALAEVKADQKAVKLKSLKRGFMYGEFNAAGLARILTELRFEADQIDTLIANWTIERDGRRKQPTVAMLGKWVKLSLISMEEARLRLQNLGYALLDADRILAAALKFDYEGVPPSAEELSHAISDVIKDQKRARKAAEPNLLQRLAAITKEAQRIHNELNRRRRSADEEELPPIMIP